MFILSEIYFRFHSLDYKGRYTSTTTTTKLKILTLMRTGLSVGEGINTLQRTEVEGYRKERTRTLAEYEVEGDSDDSDLICPT